jgi:hypothetical protein
MIYSYTQISQYLACPRRYRHRYLQGWVEKDTRAAMLFGRAFENALGAFFQKQDSAEVLFREWSVHREAALHYSKSDNWDRMLQQGIQLLDRFCQDGRVSVSQPQRHLQIKLVRPLSPQNEFVAYVDAIGYLDGTRCVLEWKTTSSRHPEKPEGLLALDPQLVCYSWMTGIPKVAQVVFVRKRLIEVQYLRTSITERTAPGIWSARERYVNRHQVIGFPPRLREAPLQKFVEGFQILYSPVLPGTHFTQVST